MNGEEAIKVEDLTVAYGEKPVLWDVDLTVPSGRAYGDNRAQRSGKDHAH